MRTSDTVSEYWFRTSSTIVAAEEDVGKRVPDRLADLQLALELGTLRGTSALGSQPGLLAGY